MSLLFKASSLTEFQDTYLLATLLAPSWSCSLFTLNPGTLSFPFYTLPFRQFPLSLTSSWIPRFSPLRSAPDTITTHFHLDDTQMQSIQISLLILVPQTCSSADFPLGINSMFVLIAEG